MLITGSSMGIGKQLAREFGRKGARLVINGRNPERLEAARSELSKEGLTVTAHAADVAEAEQCRALVRHAIDAFGRLDVLVNNAGLSTEEALLQEIQPQVFQQILSVNVLGSVYPTHFALPHLLKSRGHVLFISSAAGLRGLPGHSPYCTSKMALTALAESLRLELRPQGVEVGIAYLGFTENDPQKKVLRADGQPVPLRPRSPIPPEPVDRVARRIVRMTETGRFKAVFSPLARLLHLTNRFLPGMVSWILARKHSDH